MYSTRHEVSVQKLNGIQIPNQKGNIQVGSDIQKRTRNGNIFLTFLNKRNIYTGIDKEFVPKSIDEYFIFRWIIDRKVKERNEGILFFWWTADLLLKGVIRLQFFFSFCRSLWKICIFLHIGFKNSWKYAFEWQNLKSHHELSGLYS